MAGSGPGAHRCLLISGYGGQRQRMAFAPREAFLAGWRLRRGCMLTSLHDDLAASEISSAEAQPRLSPWRPAFCM